MLEHVLEDSVRIHDEILVVQDEEAVTETLSDVQHHQPLFALGQEVAGPAVTVDPSYNFV